jgi:DOPA 4,5-dioxygenase
MEYHAHVYWHDDDQQKLSLKLRKSLTGLGCELGRIMDHPVGPHPLPSYQVNYSSENAAQVENLLSRSGLDVLLHEDTGDDMRDHTDGARWLGQTLKLDLEWLENYTRNKNA